MSNRPRTTPRCSLGADDISPAMKRLLATPVAFGLRAQGHFDYVKQAVRAGVSWEEIGREIGWTPEAVERFYEAERLR